MKRRSLLPILAFGVLWATSAPVSAQDPQTDPTVVEEGPALDDEAMPDETSVDELYEDPGDLDEAPEEEAPPPRPAIDVRALVRSATTARAEEYGKKAYAFCVDSSYEPKPYPEERSFCKVVDDSMIEACPEVKRICEGEPEPKSDFKVPDWVTFAIEGILIVLLAAGLIYLFFSVIRVRIPNDELDLSAAPTRVEDLATLPEAPALSILRQARQRLDAGELAEAAGLLHVALLRHLEDRGLIRFHPSTTNGEYLRRIRSQPELAALYRKASGQTDRLRFGDGRVDGEVLRSAIEEATEISSRSGGNPFAGSASILLACALASSQLLACGDVEPSFFSHAPHGLAALPRFITTDGIEVKTLKEMPEELPPETGLVVVRTGFSGLGRQQTPRLDPLLDRGIALVILDDLGDPESFLPATSSITIADLDATPAPVELELTPEQTCGIDQVALAEAIAPDVLRIPSKRTIAWDGRPAKGPASDHLMAMVPLLVRKSADPYRARVVAYTGHRLGPDGESLPGCLFVFSSSAIFSNVSLTREANLEYAVGFLASLVREGETVLFIDSFADRSPSDSGMTGSLRKTRLLPFILHAGLFTALLMIAMGAAFGPLRDRVRVEHKSFAEHVEAVGRHYASAGEAGSLHAGQAMARLLVARYRRQVRGGTAAAWIGLSEDLSKKFDLDQQAVLDALCLGLEGSLKEGLMKDRQARPISEMIGVLSTLLSRGGSLVTAPVRDGGKQKWI